MTRKKPQEELKAYKATGLKPEEITIGQEPCVFYHNRKCNLDGDWCAKRKGGHSYETQN